MTRLLSLLVATIFLVSATVEIASFILDHKSWVHENYKAVEQYVTALMRSPEPAIQACGKNCAAAPEKETPHRCDGMETLPKKILCRFTLPTRETPCCDHKGKPLPGNWIRPEKGSTASLSLH